MSNTKLIYWLLFCFAAASFIPHTLAQSSAPESLQEWVPWVLKDQKGLQCPNINLGNYADQNNRICAWPGELKVDVQSESGTFSASWTVLEQSWIPLPGSDKNWPQSIKVNGKPIAVISHNNQPSMQLEAGSYNVQGEFEWQSTPEILLLPKVYPNIALSVESNTIDFPKRQERQLWLKEFSDSEAEEDSVTLYINRKVTDGSFIKLETKIELDVSGKLREEKLGFVLPEGFRLSGMRGALPAFLDASGVLHANLAPGNWELTLFAYALPTTVNWSRPEQTNVWPNQETWSFQSNEHFRSGKLNGARIVDANLAEIPEKWTSLPSFVLEPKDQLNYSVTHRGKPLHLENKLSLNRDMWLSFDNEQLFFSDTIQGTMTEDWRLSMLSPYILQSADDQNGAMLVTTMNEGEHGIENRYPAVSVNARGVVEATKSLAVTGWDNHFESVSIRLILPPGNLLFSVFGADSVSKSWTSNWSIWSSFVVLFSAFFAGRIITPIAGIVTAVLLVLIFQENEAPVISVINLLVSIGVIKYQPFEKFRPLAKTYLLVSALTAAGSLLYFSAMQIKTVIHPQLEAHDYSPISFESKSNIPQDALLLKGLSDNSRGRTDNFVSDEIEQIVVTGSRIKRVDLFSERYQADAVVQTGIGIPNWQWHQHYIEWNSPVSPQQDMDMLVLGRIGYAILKLLGVCFALVWLFLMLKSKSSDITSYWSVPLKQNANSAALILFLILPVLPENAFANVFPDQTMLDELYKTVTKAPECTPNCAVISNVNVEVKDKTLWLTGSINALAPTAIALPKSEFWRPERVKLNDAIHQGMVIHKNWVYIPVKAGITSFSISGQIQPVESFQLRFKTPPKQLKLNKTSEWEVAGLVSGVLHGDSLTFSAIRSADLIQQSQSTRYKVDNFALVSRNITLDQNWRITTSVKRISPSTGSINMRIPLLEGEFVGTPGATVNNGFIDITIPTNENYAHWESTLNKTSRLVLTAKGSNDYVEHWEIISNPSWHFKTSSLPVILGAQDDNDYFSYSFYPYDGEQLEIDITRPNAIAGNSIAIDTVTSTLEQGERTATFEINFTYRSSRGGEHTISLPEDFQLKEVRTDERIINLQPNGTQLALPISPGSHSIQVILRKDASAGMLLQYPKVNLNAPTSNIESTVKLGRSRWTLWAEGPLLGPAVIYWGQFLVFMLFAILLSRFAFSPLKTWQWLLLGFGLSLNNWATLILMATWFASLTATKFRSESTSKSAFNLSQLSLYILSVVTLMAVVVSIPMSLLSYPDMGIAGNNSYANNLKWFADQSQGSLPDISVLSAPTLIYKGIMLLWVMWLSLSLLSWVKWAWLKIGAQGYWKD